MDAEMIQEIEELKKKRRKVEKEMQRHLERRNTLNGESKRWSGIRDEYNAKVRTVLNKASDHKGRRDAINQKVREAKDVRHEFNTRVKDLDIEIRKLKKKLLPKDAESLSKLKKEQRALEFRQMTSVLSPEKERDLVTALSSISDRIRKIEKVVEENEEIAGMKAELIEAKEKAEEAHKGVNELADKAQVEHDAMIELYSQSDELRKVADDAQEKFVKAKTTADEAHALYIEYLQQVKDYDKMIAGLKQKERMDKKQTEKEREKEQLEAVFDKLKSGETLSTDDLMLLQKSG